MGSVCANCQAIIRMKPIYEDASITTPPKPGSEDCSVCCLIFQLVSRPDLRSLALTRFRVWPTSEEFMEEDPDYPNYVASFEFQQARNVPTVDVSMVSSYTFNRNMLKYIPKASFKANSDNHVRFRLCQGWLKKCIESHQRCRADPSMMQPEQLPTRLIFVGSVDQPQLFLCLSSSMSLFNEYLTLSHCWGVSKRFSLTTDNLETLKISIPFGELSKTFQDAIIVTRELGYCYLWIDALCILQDSTKDWQYESQRMAQIYSLSSCNIAASEANDSTGLLLEKRLADSFPVIDVPPTGLITWISSAFSQASIHLRPRVHPPYRQFYPSMKQGKYICVPTKLWTPKINESALERRAWVLQERALARRVVHFTSMGMFFECRQFQACEALPHGMALHNLRYDHGVDLKTRLSTASAAQPTVNEQASTCLKQWAELINNYSTRQLTYTSDKLTAISGLAKDFKPRMDALPYLAGLWPQHIAEQLVWSSPHHEASPRPRTKLQRAPSWSWASVDYKIKYHDALKYIRKDSVSPRPHHKTMALIELVDYQIEGENGEFGSTVSGWLKLGCRLLPAKMRQGSVTLPSWPYGVNTYLDADSPPTERSIYCIPVLYSEWEDRKIPKGPLARDTKMLVDGLILYSTNIKGQFQRCGVFKIDSDGSLWRESELERKQLIQNWLRGVTKEASPINQELLQSNSILEALNLNKDTLDIITII